MRCLGFFVLVCRAQAGVVARHGVVFNKIQEISPPHGQWTVSLLVDVKFYDRVLADVSTGLARLTGSLETHFQACARDADCGPWVNSLDLKEVLLYLNSSYYLVVSEFDNYHALLSVSRHKRSLFPFVGEALSVLFGTADNGDLAELRDHMKTLQSTQKKILHVVRQSITMLNVTNSEMSKNRDAINALSQSLRLWIKASTQHQDFVVRVQSRTAMLGELIRHLQIAVAEFTRQINFLSLGKLSPSIITPLQLRNVLLDIKRKLPTGVELSSEPLTHVWDFYRTLRCTTAIVDGHIVVVIAVPLLLSSGMLELYTARSVPTVHRSVLPNQRHALTLHYHVDSYAFFINSQRTLYALVDRHSALACRDFGEVHCRFDWPLFRVATSHSCVIAVFSNNEAAINTHCNKTVVPQNEYPQVFHVSNNVWMILTIKMIRFHIKCSYKNGVVTDEVSIKPSHGFVFLNDTCMASNELLLLRPVFGGKSRFSITPYIKSELQNFSVPPLWVSFDDKFKNFNVSMIPPRLGHLKQLPLSDLENELNSIMFDDHSPEVLSNWHLLIIITIVIAGGIIIFIFRNNLYSCVKSKVFRRKTTAVVDQSNSPNIEEAFELS